jgi:hypothetical protein
MPQYNNFSLTIKQILPDLMMKLRRPKNKSVNSKNSGENQD